MSADAHAIRMRGRESAIARPGFGTALQHRTLGEPGTRLKRLRHVVRWQEVALHSVAIGKVTLPSFVHRWLAHPLTTGCDLDDPATTQLRKQIVQSKPFLKAIYNEWYSTIAAQLPVVKGPVLELGSGAGHCEEFIPGLITSEIFFCPTVRLIANAQQLPFADSSLRAIVFTDVLHHMPEARRFFAEACRCLRPGGMILMIEPWVSGWSKFVYTRLHHEPFLPKAKDWAFASSGPLSGANGALPWIVFERDRREFEAEYTDLAVEHIRPFMPFRYLVSGGMGMRSLMPGFTYSLWRRMENSLNGLMPRVAMFAAIAIVRRQAPWVGRD